MVNIKNGRTMHLLSDKYKTHSDGKLRLVELYFKGKIVMLTKNKVAVICIDHIDSLSYMK